MASARPRSGVCARGGQRAQEELPAGSSPCQRAWALRAADRWLGWPEWGWGGPHRGPVGRAGHIWGEEASMPLLCLWAHRPPEGASGGEAGAGSRGWEPGLGERGDSGHALV